MYGCQGYLTASFNHLFTMEIIDTTINSKAINFYFCTSHL